MRLKPRTKFLLFSTILLSLSGGPLGCSSAEKQPELTPVEVGSGFSVDTPEAELLKDAQKFYNSNLFSTAREAFEKIRDGYPFGPYSEYAEIKIADTYFYSYDYATAALLYSDFAKQHPASVNLPYALIQLGRSYQLQYGGKGRDIEPLHKAVAAYKDLLQKVPYSIYSEAAKRYLAETQKQIVAYEKLVARYYKRVGNQAAAKARLKGVDEIKVSFNAQLANLESTKSELAGAVEVPELYEGPYQGGGESTATSTSKRKDSTANTFVERRSQDRDQGGVYKIIRIACQPERDQVFVFLNKELDSTDASLIENSLKREGTVTRLALPNTETEELSLNCMANSDLKVKSDGSILFDTMKELTVLPLSRPPRLLLVLD